MATEKEGHIPPSDSVLFILVCFSIGVLIRLGLKWTKIPYTAMLLLFGLAIGFLQLARPATQAFTNTLQLWLSMEPHLLLLVFLPIIGFSAAIAQEPHMLRKSWVQIMVLAWPGVVVQFLLIGLCAKYVFPYNWTWPESFLFGAMMAATDPVAVVAVLQEVGASQKLACVIDGESLMNDGSALVIFLVLQKIVEGQAVTVGGAIAQFCLLAVVGMLLGIVCGFLTSWLLEHIFRDPTLTTIVTLLSAYSSYYVADRLVGASGLLAVVCNGFTMSLIGGRDITMRVEDSMHAFWGVLEWGANTILFVWMGIVLAIVLPPSHEETPITSLQVHLVPSDAGYVVLLFLWLQVCRAILLLLCWIPFNYTGYPMTWRTFLVFLWGGLRGAVGMVMALFVFLDEEIHNSKFRSYAIFYMGTMAFFTVLINGGTVKWLLKTLGFMSYTPEQLTTLQHVVQDMDEIRDRRLRELGPDEVLGEPEPDVVKVWTSLPMSEMLSEAAANMVRPPTNLNSPAVKAVAAAGLDVQLLYDYRCRMLHMVKAHYAQEYSQHLLTTQQVRILQAAADKALDEAGEGLKDWMLLQPSCTLRGLPWLMRAWRVHKLSGTLVQAGVYTQQLSNLTLLVAFIHAHKHAQEVLREHIQAVGDAPVLRALSRASHTSSATHTKPGDPVQDLLATFTDLQGTKGGRGGAEALYVLQESEAAAAAAHSLAEGVTFSHPSLPAWLRSKQVAANILTEQHGFLQHLADAGLVQQRECMELETLMHDRFKLLLQSNSGLTAALSYSRSRPPLNLIPLFDSLDDEAADALMKGGSSRARWGAKEPHQDTTATGGNSSSRCHWKVYYPEQLIARAGIAVSDVIVITKGAVRMCFPRRAEGPQAVKEHTVVASVGDPLGVCELMLGYGRLADLTADSMVQCLVVPAHAFLNLVKTVPGVYTRAWQATAAQLAAQHHHILGRHHQLASLNWFFRSCLVERIEPEQTFEVPRTALLLTGSVKSLLPLPAQFSAAVQNTDRKSSAADLLWPSNISSNWDGSSDASSNGRPSRVSAPGHSGSDSMQRQASAPSSTLLQSSACKAALLGSAETQPGAAGSSDSDSSSAAGLKMSNLKVVVHDVTEQREQSTSRAPAAGSSSAAAGHGADPLWLHAPAELPPGEFKCIEQGMLLQVPRGPTMPGSLETITYQAQVLGKGSIQPELVQQPQQQQAATPFGATGETFSPSGAPHTGSSKQGGLATRSWSPSMRSPFKDALSKLSRISKVGTCGGIASGLQSQPSDVLPKMAFLQKAAQSMRTEQQRHGAVTGPPASSKQPVGAAAPTGLHTVVEVRGRSVDGEAAEAAAGAERASVAAAGAVGAGSQLQQRSVERPASFELRATDVVLGNTSLRKRALAGQQGGEDAESEGSPRAGGSSTGQGFVGHSAWPLAGAGQLAHSGLKRRSQNYS